jgi:hypothetical protein
MTKALRNTLAAILFGAFTLSAAGAFADDAKVPDTTAEHEAMAKSYTEKATEYRKVAEEHKAMAAAYAKAHPDSKGGQKNPWNAKMAKHCQALAKDAEKLAGDAQKAADFHSMRGKEQQGK